MENTDSVLPGDDSRESLTPEKTALQGESICWQPGSPSIIDSQAAEEYTQINPELNGKVIYTLQLLLTAGRKIKREKTNQNNL